MISDFDIDFDLTVTADCKERFSLTPAVRLRLTTNPSAKISYYPVIAGVRGPSVDSLLESGRLSVHDEVIEIRDVALARVPTAHIFHEG